MPVPGQAGPGCSRGCSGGCSWPCPPQARQAGCLGSERVSTEEIRQLPVCFWGTKAWLAALSSLPPARKEKGRKKSPRKQKPVRAAINHWNHRAAEEQLPGFSLQHGLITTTFRTQTQSCFLKSSSTNLHLRSHSQTFVQFLREPDEPGSASGRWERRKALRAAGLGAGLGRKQDFGPFQVLEEWKPGAGRGSRGF